VLSVPERPDVRQLWQQSVRYAERHLEVLALAEDALADAEADGAFTVEASARFHELLDSAAAYRDLAYDYEVRARRRQREAGLAGWVPTPPWPTPTPTSSPPSRSADSAWRCMRLVMP
jgi:hypothetical protein